MLPMFIDEFLPFFGRFSPFLTNKKDLCGLKTVFFLLGECIFLNYTLLYTTQELLGSHNNFANGLTQRCILNRGVCHTDIENITHPY
jgi:hypothetical protein